MLLRVTADCDLDVPETGLVDVPDVGLDSPDEYGVDGPLSSSFAVMILPDFGRPIGGFWLLFSLLITVTRLVVGAPSVFEERDGDFAPSSPLVSQSVESLAV